jgi:hypothetical protein
MLREAIQHSSAGTAPLPHILRLVWDACMLADFRHEANWFRRELLGYPPRDFFQCIDAGFRALFESSRLIHSRPH